MDSSVIDLVLNILSIVGGSSVVAAFLPLKIRKYVPIFAKLIDFLAANFGSAVNKSPEQIEAEKK